MTTLMKTIYTIALDCGIEGALSWCKDRDKKTASMRHIRYDVNSNCFTMLIDFPGSKDPYETIGLYFRMDYNTPDIVDLEFISHDARNGLRLTHDDMIEYFIKPYITPLLKGSDWQKIKELKEKNSNDIIYKFYDEPTDYQYLLQLIARGDKYFNPIKELDSTYYQGFEFVRKLERQEAEEAVADTCNELPF